MDDSARRVLAISYGVAGVVGEVARLTAVAESLDVIIPTEHSGWADLSAEGTKARLVARYGPERPEIVDAVTYTAPKHPMVLAMRAHPGSVTPLRMSDLVPISEWRDHEVYRELFRLMGITYQLTLPLVPGRLNAWVFNRSFSDFSDDTVTLAGSLQPLLAAIELFDHRGFGPIPEFVDRRRLTAREAEILNLIASGMSTMQIAYMTRVSPRTVNKHIEHLYDKLGVHDRVSAAMLVSAGGLASNALSGPSSNMSPKAAVTASAATESIAVGDALLTP